MKKTAANRSIRPALADQPKRRIGRRIGAIVGLTVAAFGLGGLFLVVQQTNQTQEAISQRHLDTLAHTIDASFAMFDPRTGRHPIEEIAAQLGAAPHVEGVDVFDRYGRIRWSSEPRRRGKLADAAALSVLTHTSTTVAAPADPGRIRAIRPLRKRASCLPCHKKSSDPIGGVSIHAERRVLLGNLVSYSWEAAVLVIAFSLVLILILLALLNRTVVARLTKLVDVMVAAERGDYLVRASVDAQDEIGHLTFTFNRMLAKITDLRVEHIEAEREMEEVKDELALERALAEKSAELEDANRRLETRITELSFLNRLARDLATKLDLEFTLERFCEDVTEQLNVPEVAVLLFDKKDDRIRAIKWHGFKGDRGVIDRPFDKKTGITGEAVEQEEPVYVPDTSVGDRAVAYRSDTDRSGTLFCVPMKYQDGVIGILAFSSPETDAFSEDDRELLVTIANQAALALANAQLFQETLELSIRDGLTGILNRRGLDDRFQLEWSRALRDESDISVVMIDIDHFKKYNDQHGHQAGDTVLRRVAHLLESNLRKVDAVGRYGGEEFAVVLPRAKRSEALEVAKKLRRSIAEADFPHGYMQPLGRVTISCGVATAPQDATSREALVHRADEALLAAKEGGRNRVYVSEGPGSSPAS